MEIGYENIPQWFEAFNRMHMHLNLPLLHFGKFKVFESRIQFYAFTCILSAIQKEIRLFLFCDC